MARQTLNKVDEFMELSGLSDESIMLMVCLGLSSFTRTAKRLENYNVARRSYSHLEIANSMLKVHHNLPAWEDL